MFHLMCFAYYDLHSSYCAFICMHECIYRVRVRVRVRVRG